MKNKKANADDFYRKMNIMQRHSMVGGFAKDVIRKLGSEAITKEREREMFNKGFNEGVNASLVTMVNMLWNDWHILTRKDKRLKEALDIFVKKLEMVDHPDEKQLAAEAAFNLQTGAEITR